MAIGKACKSVVFGRVIWPAELKSVGNDTYFMNFTVYVDSLAKSKENRKERKSGKINCSYVVKGDPYQDMNVVILANIFNKKTNMGSLGGQVYKSVEVLVEGNLSLSETEGSSYYVGLEYCNVTVTSNDVIGLYRAEMDSGSPAADAEVEEVEEEVEEPVQQVAKRPQLPTMAPQRQAARVATKSVATRQTAPTPKPQVRTVAKPATVAKKAVVRPPVQEEYEEEQADDGAEEAAQSLAKSSRVITGGRVQAVDSIKSLLEGGDGEFMDDLEGESNPFTE